MRITLLSQYFFYDRYFGSIFGMHEKEIRIVETWIESSEGVN